MADALAPAPAWFRAARAVVRRLPAGRFRAFNLLARAPLPPFADRLGRQAAGMAYRCDLRDLVAREMCLTGGYAPLEAALVRATLPAGGTFVDVGANIGFFTLLAAAKVGAGGRVVALEPHPGIADVLRQNVAMNGLPHVRVMQVAAADTGGRAVLSGFAEDGGNWGVSSLAGAPGGGPGFDVRCALLDELMDEAEVASADLVKVDVEGAEHRVLRGMRDGLRAGRYARVLVEMHPWTYGDFATELGEMVEEMRSAEYTGWLMEESRTAIRRAYYGVPAVPGLRPLDPSAATGTWPHVLWTLPGREVA